MARAGAFGEASGRVALVGALFVLAGVSWPLGAAAVLPQQQGAVDLLTQANVQLDGAAAGGFAGSSVAGAGDVNGDGRADVIVGATGTDNNGRTNSGSAYVVFGRAETASVDLAALGAGGFRIDGAAAGDLAGRSVAGAGDLNGDGRADVIVGASQADNNGRAESGSAYVVFGRAGSASVDLAALGAGGLRIDGAGAGDLAGSSVAGAGDVNGDGRADAIVGASQADNNGRTNSGSAYVVLGFGVPSLSYPPLVGQVGRPIAPLRPSVARTGPASFSVSPALPAGLFLDPATGVVSGTPLAPTPPSTYTVTMTDLAGSTSAPLAITVSAAPPRITPFADCPSQTANLIRGSAAGERINGTVAGDRIFAGTGNDVVDGLAGDDCIDLGPGTDSGQGGLGDDLLLGGLGADRMAGSSGNDTLRGGSSGDRLNGGFGNDRLHGQSGADRVSGSRGRDRVNGGSSNDVISAGSSDDRVAGDQGSDRINGNSGNDSLSGNSGRDRINGSSGADRIAGGSGADRISVRDGRRDRVNCGSGRDRVIADRIDRVAGNCERVSRR